MPLVPFDGQLPEIHPTAWVTEATIVGRASFAAGASAFFGAVVRADVNTISVGEGTNLQDNVVVHCDAHAPCSIGSRVSVGHGAVVHGCTVEDDSLIGINAIVLNHAVIGAGSLVAAGSVVLEGTVVPPGSLVAGVPAKVRREVTAEETAWMRQNASEYAARAQVYANR